MSTSESVTTAYLITVTQEVPENLRSNMDVTNPESVLNEFAKIGYVTQANFIYQRSRLTNVEGKLRTSVEVNGWILKFYHVFNTLENANNFMNGVYREVYDENTALRGFELTPKSTTIEEITVDSFLRNSSIQGFSPPQGFVPSFDD